MHPNEIFSVKSWDVGMMKEKIATEERKKTIVFSFREKKHKIKIKIKKKNIKKKL